MTSTAHWSNDIIVSLSLAYYAPFASLPLLTEIPSFHPKGDRPTDMCNPTDAIASKKSLTIVFVLIRMNENTWKPIAFCLGATGTGRTHHEIKNIEEKQNIS